MDFPEEDEFSCYKVNFFYIKVLRMLEKRGYDVEAEMKQYKNLSEEEFWNEKKTWPELNMRYKRKEANNNNLKREIQTIWIPPDDKSDKVGVDQLVKQLKQVSPEKADVDFLFVAEKPLGSPAENKLVNLSTRIEYWTYDRLRIDVPEHHFTDKVEVLSEEEANSLLRRLQINPENIPKLSSQDIICRYYAFLIGTIVKITSDRENLGLSVSYKIVTPISYTNEPITSEIFQN